MNQLFLVSTPIGNLGDLSFRAAQTLTDSAVVLCEDTRRTGKLFVYISEKYGLTTKPRLVRFDDTTENKDLEKFIDIIKNNESVSIVSDAGTPLINDPGYKLVREINNNHKDISIINIPGPSSIITTLILSGMEPDNFMFIGYLPRKDGQRETLFKQCLQINVIKPTTFVALETVFRLEKTLKVLDRLFDEKVTVFVAHELTKLHESTFKGTPKQLIEKCSKLKGEITISFRFV
jgi:16S rRNA (cytidine1402-2'-O)-methyltransferase